MNIWLSSDWHLGHANIAGKNTSNWKEGYRNFNSVEEMDDTIIDNINKYVNENDTIFFHGDFSFGGHTKIPDYRRRIECKTIHVIRGNHDHHIKKYKDYFTSVQDYLDITLKAADGRKIPFIMCHYAFRIWLGSHKGFMHTYGHSHSSLEHRPHGKSMDVGIDNAYKVLGEHRPFHLDEVIDILDKRSIQFVDHHTSEKNAR